MRVEEFEVAWSRCFVQVTLDDGVKAIGDASA